MTFILMANHPRKPAKAVNIYHAKVAMADPYAKWMLAAAEPHRPPPPRPLLRNRPLLP